ncbi:hypothetical protein ETB97_008454 [Aspergillus alliaceus]|uniref:Uncharacterized protein n=1 Tax=Petromyces alliaceus TaxID=209559 RepID=A0A8H5ZS12_PETAA|nr:hypothetical protein ETB97_008454 [Aspergillus burnettii]
MDHSALICLATETADVACNLAVELPQRGLPESSFEHGLPSPFQSDSPDSGAFAARVKLLGLLDEFHNLLTEPVLLSSPELSADPSLAHAASYHISFQSGPDFFIHTADSPVLTKNEGMHS